METTTSCAVNLTGEDLGILTELLSSERAKLSVEIRHTDHRSFRDELRHRLASIENLLERLQAS